VEVLFYMGLIFIGGIILFIIIAIFSSQQEKKRRAAIAVAAANMGLQFDENDNRSLAKRYEFLDKLCEGSNRYAFNVLSGSFHEEEICVFDYHYETHSTDSKGRTTTHHHYFSVYLLCLPKSFPELTITHEGFFSKIAQAFGYDDIDFESHEFSKRFCVRSSDKKFAYDICNAKMIEYLLLNTDLNIEIEKQTLALIFSEQLNATLISKNINQLLQVRQRFPEYLWNN
jgi:hypothetical protein